VKITMAYTLLTTTSLTEFYPEYADGVAVVNNHGSLSQLLSSEINRGASDFLAAPLEQVKENHIKWYTTLEGDIASYESMEGERRERGKDALYGVMGDYSACASKLLASGSPQSKLAGKLVSSLALSVASVLAGVPTPSKVFFVGDVPVLTGWGLILASEVAGNSRGSQITEKEFALVQRVLAGERIPEPISQGPPPEPLPLGPGAPEEIAPPVAPPVAPPIVPAPLMAREAMGCLALLPLLLMALGTMLLLLLLAFLLIPGLRPAFLVPPVPLAALDEERDREATLRTERDLLLDQYLLRLDACPPVIETAKADLTEIPPLKGTPLEIPEEAIKDPELPETIVEETVEETVEEPEEEIKELDEELIIPDDPKNLDFLEGCWISDAGLVDHASDLPVTYKYCFDGSGEADVSVDQFDSKGKLRNTCVGRGVATMDGNTLRIKDRGTICSENEGYVPTTVICQAAEEGKPAVCTVQSEGGRLLNSLFTYAGKK
jgi:hypothetical protein